MTSDKHDTFENFVWDFIECPIEVECKIKKSELGKNASFGSCHVIGSGTIQFSESLI